MLYCEITSEPTKRFGHIVKVEELPLYKGFRSLYFFDEQAVSYFKEIGRVKNLKKFPVYSSSLTIDIDNNEEGFKETLEKIKKVGYKFEAWSSGGKGYHIVLFHEELCDANLPYWHRNWVEKRKIACDLCIYESGRIIRLPGTIHAKTGKPKILLEESDGSLIEIEKVEPVRQMNSSIGSQEDDALGLLGLQLRKYVDVPITCGERNRRVYSLCRGFFDCGFSSDALSEFAHILNDSIEEPLEEEELSNIVNSIAR